MRTLAIDPGSMLGFATDATGRLEYGTEDFRIKGGESSGNRWRRFGDWLISASLRFEAEATLAKVDLIVYEKSHFPSAARYAADVAAGFTTRLEEHCERHGIALQPVAVQTLKAFALPATKRPAKKKGEPPRLRHDTSKAAMIAAACDKLVALAIKEGKPPYPHLSPKFMASESDKPIGISLEGARVGELVTVKTFGLGEHEADALWLYWYSKKEVENARTR